MVFPGPGGADFGDFSPEVSLKIASGRKISRSGGAGPGIFRVLDSVWFQLAVSAPFVWMLIFSPVSSVPVFRIGLTLGIGLLVWIFLQKRRKRGALAAGSCFAVAALAAVWLVAPDTAGFAAVAGWLIFLGSCAFRRRSAMQDAGAPAWECFFEAVLGGAMAVLGGALLLRSGSMDYLASAPSCALGVFAAALGGCSFGKAAKKHRKRRA